MRAMQPFAPLTKSSRYNLRSNTNSGQEAAKASRVTDFFAVRKRGASSSSDGGECNKAVTPMKKSALEKLTDDQVVPGRNSPSKTARKTEEPTPLGDFKALPHDALLALLHQLPSTCLARLCAVSVEAGAAVREYLLSPEARSRFRRETIALSSDQDRHRIFRIYGNVVKSASVVLTVNERVQFIFDFFAMNSDVKDVDGWGAFFRAVCRHWEFFERAGLAKMIFNHEDGLLERNINTVVTAKAGEHPELEIHVRRTLRGYFLGGGVSVENSFWLSMVLRTRITVEEQARLLFILYGPTKVVYVNRCRIEVIDWNFLASETVKSESESAFFVGPLASALCDLAYTKNFAPQSQQFIWSDITIFNFIEELTTVPEAWTFDNFVSLFVHRPALLPNVVSMRMRNGLHNDVGDILNVLITRIYRWGLSMTHLFAEPLARVTTTLTNRERRLLLGTLCAAHGNSVYHLASSHSMNSLSVQLKSWDEAQHALAVLRFL